MFNKYLDFIVIIGPDGCGKTTIANNLGEKLPNQVLHRAANFECIPTLSEMIVKFKSFFAERKENYIRNTDEYKGFHSGMQQSPNSIIKSLILISWYTIDYILGFYVLRKSLINNEVFIFSRYFYDYYFQISNKNLSHRVIAFYELFVPKPTYVFYLSDDAQAIYERKPELTVEEISRQQNTILKVLSTRDNFYVLDNSGTIESTVGQALEVIKRKAHGIKS